MKKAILMAIQPQYLFQILNGEKIDEIRKTIPKCELPIDVYLYCTKSNLNLYSEFVEVWQYFDGAVAEPFAEFKQLNLTSEKLEINKKIRTGRLSRLFRTRLNGKVPAKFTLKICEELACEDLGYEKIFYTETKDDITNSSCLSQDQIILYLGNQKKYKNGEIVGSDWQIDNLEIFDKPMELSDFKIKNKELQQYGSFGWVLDNQSNFVSLTKAPQSWQYVYVEDNK
ncbi:MAG: RNA-binding domain containing protein [Podoviridae sp. ctcf755]|nr:MAG: RNA-binding domain containing protein [Podoviridae sp. ctcf755]